MNPTSDLDDYKGGHIVHVVGYVDNSALASNPGTKTATPGAGGGYLIIKSSWSNATATQVTLTCQSHTCSTRRRTWTWFLRRPTKRYPDFCIGLNG